MLNEKKTLQLGGLPWHIALSCVAVTLIGIYLEVFSGAVKLPKGEAFTPEKSVVIPSGIAIALAIAFGIGLLFHELGERLPIWNSYIGGGILMVFFGSSLLNYFNVVPQKYVLAVEGLVSGKNNFLNVFIILLICGSILALERKVLLRSFFGYIPAILGGLVCSMLFGVLAGLAFGFSPQEIIIKYALPIMGGGNGAGAVPLSQIYERVTGQDKSVYYGFAIVILTIANVISIVAGALLNTLGKKKQSLTGDGSNLIRNAREITSSSAETDSKYDLKDIGGALFLAFSCYTVGLIIAKKLLPTVFGAAIHEFAYMIIFVVILAAFGVIPKRTCNAAKRLQSTMTTVFTTVIMVGMGFDFDLNELAQAFTIQNFIIALAVVIGAIVGSAIVGHLVGFYPIDTAVTAGLCMANRGGSGDLAVLGAAKRMDLIAYAQLSSRLGGGIVLIIGSILFSFWL